MGLPSNTRFNKHVSRYSAVVYMGFFHFHGGYYMSLYPKPTCKDMGYWTCVGPTMAPVSHTPWEWGYETFNMLYNVLLFCATILLAMVDFFVEHQFYVAAILLAVYVLCRLKKVYAFFRLKLKKVYTFFRLNESKNNPLIRSKSEPIAVTHTKAHEKPK